MYNEKHFLFIREMRVSAWFFFNVSWQLINLCVTERWSDVSVATSIVVVFLFRGLMVWWVFLFANHEHVICYYVRIKLTRLVHFLSAAEGLRYLRQEMFCVYHCMGVENRTTINRKISCNTIF